MERLLLALCLLTSFAFPQSGAVIPQGGAGHAAQASCVILKRMGPADQVTSRLYSFGIRGKQFQYVEGKLPDGFPFHGRLTDHDVRNLQARGTEVIVVNQNYTVDDLKQARADCRGETGTTPVQSEAKDKPVQTSTKSGEAADVEHIGNRAPDTATINVTSNPDGADIYSDGSFVGNAPSTLKLAPGKHTVRLTSAGRKDWSRDITVQSGSEVKLNAVLDKE